MVFYCFFLHDQLFKLGSIDPVQNYEQIYLRKEFHPNHTAIVKMVPEITTCFAGTPIGRLDKYLCLVGHRTAVLSWEQQLEGAIQDIVSKMPANQTTLMSAIAMTAKHILETTKIDMEKSK